MRRFTLLGATVLSVFALSFGPFAHQLPQVLSRLFPFKRGLCHSYWAPNVWALYSFADRILIKVLPRLLTNSTKGSLTRGLVGDSEFSVLPTVTPWHTLVLTLVTQLVILSRCCRCCIFSHICQPILYQLWKNPKPSKFMEALILCGFSSFLFGWHVHEKAILLMLIPLRYEFLNIFVF